jgi:hypothetical protein
LIRRVSSESGEKLNGLWVRQNMIVEAAITLNIITRQKAKIARR